MSARGSRPWAARESGRGEAAAGHQGPASGCTGWRVLHRPFKRLRVAPRLWVPLLSDAPGAEEDSRRVVAVLNARRSAPPDRELNGIIHDWTNIDAARPQAGFAEGMKRKYLTTTSSPIPHDPGTLAGFITSSTLSPAMQMDDAAYIRSRLKADTGDIAVFIAWLFAGSVSYGCAPGANVNLLFPVDQLRGLAAGLEDTVQLEKTQKQAPAAFQSSLPTTIGRKRRRLTASSDQRMKEASKSRPMPTKSVALLPAAGIGAASNRLLTSKFGILARQLPAR